jgi:hypothetical protein
VTSHISLEAKSLLDFTEQSKKKQPVAKKSQPKKGEDFEDDYGCFGMPDAQTTA